tara:strand:- start:1552 stop:1758 length:207 start_codon:yes stop_codon:yes gene_type:complete
MMKENLLGREVARRGTVGHLHLGFADTFPGFRLPGLEQGRDRRDEPIENDEEQANDLFDGSREHHIGP